jgi:hypothetical protein
VKRFSGWGGRPVEPVYRTTPRPKRASITRGLAVLMVAVAASVGPSSGAAAATGGATADGGTWRALPPPTGISRFEAQTLTVAGGDGAFWAASYRRDPGFDFGHEFLRRWDGTAWSHVQVDMDGRGYVHFEALSSASGGTWLGAQVWNWEWNNDDDAVKTHQESLVERWDGTQFIVTARYPAEDGAVESVTDGRAWLSTRLAATYWDGTSWVSYPYPPGFFGNHVVAGPAGVWALGASTSTDGAAVLQLVDGAWVDRSPPAGTFVDAFSGTELTGAPGLAAVLQRVDGDVSVGLLTDSGWRVLPEPRAGGGSPAVAASTSADVWLAFSDRLEHWNGRAWSSTSQQTSGNPGELPDGRIWNGLETLSPLDPAAPPGAIGGALGTQIWWRAGDRPWHASDRSGAVTLDLLPESVGDLRADVAGSFLIAGLADRVSLAVPPAVSQAAIDPGSTVRIRFAPVGAGLRADVELKRPHTSVFVAYRRDVRRGSLRLKPDAGPGIYGVRVRVHAPGRRPSGWSPPTSVRVRSTATAFPYWRLLARPVGAEPWSPYTLGRDGSLYAVGGGSVWRTAGDGTVTTIDLPPTPVESLAAPGAHDLWIATGYSIYHWNGSRVRPVTLPHAGFEPFAVAAAGRAVWVASNALPGPELAERTRHGWRVFAQPEGYTGQVAVGGRNDVWTAGEQGVRHWDGTSWSTVPVPFDMPVSRYQVTVLGRHRAAIYAREVNGPTVTEVVFWNGADLGRVRTYPGEVDVVAGGPADRWITGEHRGLTDSQGAPWVSELLGVRRDGSAIARGCCPANGWVYDLRPMQLDTDGFVQPRAWVPVDAPVAWHVVASAEGRHGVREVTGLAQLPARLHRAGRTFFARFPAAGTYTIIDPATGSRAKVGVRLVRSGGSLVVSGSMPPGDVVDVQTQAPGSEGFTDWITGGVDGTPELPADPGTYLFRARLRDATTGVATGWSPVLTVTIA